MYDKLMSNKCSNCDYLLSIINNTKIKANGRSHAKIAEFPDKAFLNDVIS